MYRYSARSRVAPVPFIPKHLANPASTFCRGCERGLPLHNGHHYDPLGKYKAGRCYKRVPISTHSPTPRIFSSNSKHTDPRDIKRQRRLLAYRGREPGEPGPALPYLARKIDLLQDKPATITVGCFKLTV
jgi:hypothetical protein